MFVLSARPFRFSTWLATGVWPMASPPVTDDTVALAAMARERRVIYLCLHGYEGDSVLYGGDGDLPALRADQIPYLPHHPVVYLAGCWGFGMVSDAFRAAGASAVVADQNVNWSGRFLPTGSNGLGRLFLAGLAGGMTPRAAFDAARRQYARDHKAARDAELLASVVLV